MMQKRISESEKKAIKRWKYMQNEKIRKSYPSPNTVRVIEAKTRSCSRHEGMRNSPNILL
jgi:hypothetical protein